MDSPCGVIVCWLCKIQQLIHNETLAMFFFLQLDQTSATIMDIGCPLAQWWFSCKEISQGGAENVRDRDKQVLWKTPSRKFARFLRLAFSRGFGLGFWEIVAKKTWYFPVLGLFRQNSRHPFEFHPWIPCRRRFTSPLHGMSLFCVDPSHFVYLEFIEVPNRSFPFAGCFSL